MDINQTGTLKWSYSQNFFFAYLNEGPVLTHLSTTVLGCQSPEQKQNRNTATTPKATPVHQAGPIGNHLPPSSLQNNKNFKKTSGHPECLRLKAAIPDPPIVAFRRPHNFRDLLVRAKLKETNPPTQTGNHPCNSPRCKTCHMIRIEETFKSHSTGTTHKTRSTFTCKTRNLVYLIQRRKCGLQYVGETANPLHIRMNGHRSDIHTQKTDKPVAAHFNLPDHTLDDLQVRVSRTFITMTQNGENTERVIGFLP